MSILTKNVTCGEDLKVHVLFYNKELTKKEIIATLVIKKDGKNFDKFFIDKKFTIPERKHIEFYFSKKITKKYKPGKYELDLTMNYGGEDYKSETKTTDFFKVHSKQISQN